MEPLSHINNLQKLEDALLKHMLTAADLVGRGDMDDMGDMGDRVTWLTA